ncbi:MAG: hypothetical protein ACRERX_21625 [Pseudomonas sp.]
MPYYAPDALVTVWPHHFLGNRDIDYLRRNLNALREVASVSPGWLMALTGVEQPTEVDAVRVSGNLFETLGVRPHLGRTLRPRVRTARRARGGCLELRLLAHAVPW